MPNKSTNEKKIDLKDLKPSQFWVQINGRQIKSDLNQQGITLQNSTNNDTGIQYGKTNMTASQSFRLADKSKA